MSRMRSRWRTWLKSSLRLMREQTLRWFGTGHHRDNGMSVSETDDELPEATSVGFTSVSAGGQYSCGLRTDNTVTCWDTNRDGQTAAPTGTFTTVSAGGWHTCGIRTDNTVACWS